MHYEWMEIRCSRSAFQMFLVHVREVDLVGAVVEGAGGGPVLTLCPESVWEHRRVPARRGGSFGYQLAAGEERDGRRGKRRAELSSHSTG